MMDFSAVILCGGTSSRMGMDKALIDFNGQALLSDRITMFKNAGAKRIIVSGPPRSAIPADYIGDEIHCRGPLGGLHAALKYADCGKCAVIAVDMPFVTADVFTRLLDHSTRSITLARHSGRIEPLCGVYDAGLHSVIADLIRNKNASVMALANTVGYETIDFTDDRLFVNLNTPADLTVFR